MSVYLVVVLKRKMLLRGLGDKRLHIMMDFQDIQRDVPGLLSGIRPPDDLCPWMPVPGRATQLSELSGCTFWDCLVVCRDCFSLSPSRAGTQLALVKP